MFSCDRSTKPWRVRPQPASFTDNDDRGLSVHSIPVLLSRERDLNSVYDDERFASVQFPVNVPNKSGVPVTWTTPTIDEEPDRDRRAAHADMHISSVSKHTWREARNHILGACEWVQPWRPEHLPT